MKKIIFGLLFAFLLIGLTELLLRLAGYSPYRKPFIDITFQPSFNHLPDPVLGYSLADGSFTVTAKVNNDSLVYHTTHRNGQRITDTVQTDATAKSGEIVLLGCSYTYGQGLDDTATCAFVLQQKLKQQNKNVRVVNRGVGGYGPTQFYLLSGTIDSATTALVVINYAAFQDERTTLCRSWRKLVVPNQTNTANFATIRAPYFSPGAGVPQLGYRQMTYTFLPLQKSLALVELLDQLYCRYEQKKAANISRQVLSLTLQQLTKKGIPVLLCGITPDEGTKATLMAFEKSGYNTLLYGVAVQNPKYNLLPKDVHPNYTANLIFADSLFNFIMKKNYLH